MLEGLKMLFQILLVVPGILYLYVKNLICPDEFRFNMTLKYKKYDSMEEIYKRIDNTLIEIAMLSELTNKLLDDKQDISSKVSEVGVFYTEIKTKGDEEVTYKHIYPDSLIDIRGIRGRKGTLHIYTNDLGVIPPGYKLYEEGLDDDGNVMYRVSGSPEKVDSGTQNQSKIIITYLSSAYYNSKEKMDEVETIKRDMYEVYGDDMPKQLRPESTVGRRTKRRLKRWLKYLKLK